MLLFCRLLLALAIALELRSAGMAARLFLDAPFNYWGVPLFGFELTGYALLALTAFRLSKAAAILLFAWTACFFGMALPAHQLDYHSDGFVILCSLGLALLSRANGTENPRTWYANISHLLLACLSVAYLDSALWKVGSSLWMNGLGYWTPASYPFMGTGYFAGLLDVKAASLMLGYVALAFEFLFGLSIFFTRVRTPLLLGGILFHLGIGIALPIPLFALVMIALILTTLKLDSLAQGASPSSEFRIVLAVIWIFGLMLFARTPGIAPIVGGGRIGANLIRAAERASTFMYPLFGMGSHAVFLDSHFQGPRPEYTFAKKNGNSLRRIGLGLGESGPGDRTVNRAHSYWFFRDGHAIVGSASRMNAIRRAAIDLPGDSILVYKRTVNVPLDGWEHGVRNRELQRAWQLDTTIASALDL